MSRPYISEDLRRLVVNRASNLCEYCLIHSQDTFWGCEIDHIISLKHGGATIADNLAYACSFCNRNKGSDLGSIFAPTGELVRFFNPRIDRWAHHFRLNGVMIEFLTAIGEVTVRILQFNENDRLLERQVLVSVGRYPVGEALIRINQLD